MNDNRNPDQLPATGDPRHHRGTRAADKQLGLRIRSLNRSVSESQALCDPGVMLLLGEDCCWQSARAAWKRRRPAFWRLGRRRAWRAERPALREKLRRLRELGTELGLPPVSRARRRWRR
jgi:hypothetical protein